MPTFGPSQDRLNETSDDEPADPEIAWSLRWLALLALSTIFFKIVGSSEIALAFHWARPLLPLVCLWPGQIILVAFVRDAARDEKKSTTYVAIVTLVALAFVAGSFLAMIPLVR